MLSEQTGTWCSFRSGKKVWRPRHTAVISRQLMCSRPSASDQEPKAGLPSHRAPQPVLDASVETTFLLRIMPIVTPCLNHCGSFQGARAVTQAWLTLMRRHPWRHAWGGICGFSQYWRGLIRSRPNWSTGDARPWGPASFETSWEGERLWFWKKPRAAVWPVHVLAQLSPSCGLSRKLLPGTKLVGWETVSSWQNWPWDPGTLSGWGGRTCGILARPPTGLRWASRQGNSECGLPSPEKTGRLADEGPDFALAGTIHPDGYEWAPPVQITPIPAFWPL